MKKIKALLMALCILCCTAATACDISGFIGGGSVGDSTLSTQSDTQTDGESSNTEETSNEGETSKDSGDSSDGSDGGNSSDSGDPDDGEEVNVPEGKMLATVYYYTITCENDKPLTYSGLVDKNATLNEFFNEHLDGIAKVFNEAHGYAEEDYYGNEFFTGGFWQIGTRLLYGDSLFSDVLSENTKSFHINFTPSGWGLMTGICVCEDPTYVDRMEQCIPFPWGVCIEDFVNWAYARDIFEMTYEQSLTQGYWVDAMSGERVDSAYMTWEGLLCFVYNPSDIID